MSTTYAARMLLLLSAAALSACATYDVASGTWNPAGKPTSSATLEEKCTQQRHINSWTKDCLEWEQQRAAAAALAAAEKREADQSARLARQQALAEQQMRARELREREDVEAMKEDERQGYKTLTFEDFALDAESMAGARVAVHGLYVARGERLARDPISAIRWIEGGYESHATLLPLLTSSARRDSRASLLKCQESPVGWCPVVVKGRVKTLTLRNRLGVVSRQIGIEVESVR